MNAKAERLYTCLTAIDDALLDGAAQAGFQGRKHHWKRWTALAAAAALVIGVGGWTVSHWRMGSSTRAPNAGAPGCSGASTFMSYAGPVFPLTLEEEDSCITARREITLDFAPWVPVWWSNEDEADSREEVTSEVRQKILEDYNKWYPEGGHWLSSTDVLVTDAYTLQNHTEEDRTVTVLYPFVSSLREVTKQTPTLSADGGELTGTLHAGGYSGAFQAVEGSDGSEHLLNLDQLSSWEEYRALLSDGRYLEAALEEYPDLSGIPVTVYKFTDAYAPEIADSEKVPNPTIQAGFDLDYDKTTVLSYGFHGGRWDQENGHMIQSFSIREPGSRWYGEPYFLYVLGDDICSLTTGGYVTGGADPDTKRLDGCGVTVERYKTNLESALREAAELMYSGADWENKSGEIGGDRPDFGLYFGLMKEFLCSYGKLSEDSVERYHTGWLENMDFVNVDRVFYLKAEVTIPAGGSVELAAHIRKEASFDHYCAYTENQGVSGFDMVTSLGSNLNCTAQTAVLEDRGQIEIVRQNFGFDLDRGIKTVEIPPEQEHCYLEVRRAEE